MISLGVFAGASTAYQPPKEKPGTPASAAYADESYAMTKKGQAQQALNMAQQAITTTQQTVTAIREEVRPLIAKANAIADEASRSATLAAAQVEKIDSIVTLGTEVEAMMRSVIEQFNEYAKLNKKLSQDAGDQLAEIEEPAKLADAIAAQLSAKVADKQALLTETDTLKRLEMVFGFMEGELGVLQVERKIRGRVKRQMEKTQREYYLNEQLKAIQKELGEGDERTAEMDELRRKVDEARMPEEARKEAERELDRLSKMPPAAAEYTVARTYLDWLTSIPWDVSTDDNLDIAAARQVLDEDHYGLEKVKER